MTLFDLLRDISRKGRETRVLIGNDVTLCIGGVYTSEDSLRYRVHFGNVIAKMDFIGNSVTLFGDGYTVQEAVQMLMDTIQGRRVQFNTSLSWFYYIIPRKIHIPNTLKVKRCT